MIEKGMEAFSIFGMLKDIKDAYVAVADSVSDWNVARGVQTFDAMYKLHSVLMTKITIEPLAWWMHCTKEQSCTALEAKEFYTLSPQSSLVKTAAWKASASDNCVLTLKAYVHALRDGMSDMYIAFVKKKLLTDVENVTIVPHADDQPKLLKHMTFAEVALWLNTLKKTKQPTAWDDRKFRRWNSNMATSAAIVKVGKMNGHQLLNMSAMGDWQLLSMLKVLPENYELWKCLFNAKASGKAESTCEPSLISKILANPYVTFAQDLFGTKGNLGDIQELPSVINAAAIIASPLGAVAAIARMVQLVNQVAWSTCPVIVKWLESTRVSQGKEKIKVNTDHTAAKK